MSSLIWYLLFPEIQSDYYHDISLTDSSLSDVFDKSKNEFPAAVSPWKGKPSSPFLNDLLADADFKCRELGTQWLTNRNGA